MAIEFDRVANVQALNLPRVAKIEPIVGLLVLKSVHNGLHTNSVHDPMSLVFGLDPWFNHCLASY